MLEYDSAVKNKKKIVIVKHHKYDPQPGDAEPWPGVKEMLERKQYILYNPAEVKDCVTKILREMYS